MDLRFGRFRTGGLVDAGPWTPLVGDAITNAVISFFTHRNLPGEANSSLIVLIPKTTNLTLVNSFCPISLYNVVYKIISKLLVAKLRPFLHKNCEGAHGQLLDFLQFICLV